MDEKAFKPFNWQLPLYGALAAIFVLLPKILFGNDVGTFLLTVLLGAIVCVALLIVVVLQIRRQIISSLLMLVVFCAVCLALFRVSDDVRTVGRWTIHEKAYKAEVLAQPSLTNASLKHMEWDGWGFAGSGDTVLYLVFDPNDSLASAARIGAPGKFSGIPCEVPHVRRLEHQWYTVLFYTDTDWDHCNSKLVVEAITLKTPH
jgi:hypothetical protein